MSINSSVQQLSGGIASVFAGLIVVQSPTGKLVHYNTVGYIVATTMILTIIMMRSINKNVLLKSQLQETSQVIPADRLIISTIDPVKAGKD
jgi:hypothetical protein